MPLGKYYCDYCDKQFRDTPSARSRHLQGVQHQRAKSLWYDSFRSAGGDGGVGGVLPQGVCNHFVRTGFCKYGDGCRYFHPKQNVPNANQAMPGLSSAETVHAPMFWGNQLIGGSVSGDTVKDHSGISWGNLPPSLRPPPEGGYPCLPFVDWG